MMPRLAGLYIHIPFCRRKCGYCDFASYAGCEPLIPAYLAALEAELVRRAPAWAATRFDTLFCGGGTPSLLPPPAVARLLAVCRQHLHLRADAEISLEANPGTVTRASLGALRAAGVNRLSLGVQSLRADELALLGRIHTAREAVEAVAWARAAGFSNLNLDLIYGLPRQSGAAWRETLAGALTLAPEHLSLYALTLEEGTLLAEQVAAHALPAPDDDTVATMYEEAEAALDVAGYTHYEISNWARRNAQDTPGRPRFACQHNLVYWHNRAYLGLGAAAHSYDGARRSANTPELAEYIARATADQDATSQSEELAPPARMGETMMLELRLLAGVGREEFAQRFGVGLDEEYGREIVELVEDGLLVADAAGIRLSARGRLLGNRVFAAFLRP